MSQHPLSRTQPADLSRELGAWGFVAPVMFGRGEGEALVEDTDPFSRLDGKTSAEFYRQAEATCMPLSFGRLAVENRILAEGWVIQPGTAGGRDAEELRDWTASWLGRRELRLTPALPLLTSYLFYGWHPYNVLWEDWTWSRTVTSRRSGRRFKVPSRIIEKDGRMFRFNVDRDLVFTGFGAQRLVIPITKKTRAGIVARMKWLTPRRGSEDVPYGRGIYRTSGAAAAYLIWRDLWPQWQRGVDRSQGVLLAERVAGGVAAKVDDETFRSQLEETIEFMNSTGILSPTPDVNMSWLENTAAYSEGWKDPLDRLEALIALSVTGQGLAIGIGRGGAGSRAAGEVEEGRSARWARGYANDLAEEITTLSDRAILWNWGHVPEDLRPRFVFRSSRTIDMEKLVAYVDLASGNPEADPPDFRLIADEWQIPTVEGGEWQARPLEAVPPLELVGSSHEDEDEGSSHEDDEDDRGLHEDEEDEEAA